ncbi:MAG: hypothetical protein Q8R13_01430 [bacterium]|nr:hypothetical protein [bacterium]
MTTTEIIAAEAAAAQERIIAEARIEARTAAVVAMAKDLLKFHLQHPGRKGQAPCRYANEVSTAKLARTIEGVATGPIPSPVDFKHWSHLLLCDLCATHLLNAVYDCFCRRLQSDLQSPQPIPEQEAKKEWGMHLRELLPL